MKKSDLKVIKLIADFVDEHRETIGQMHADASTRYDDMGERAQEGDRGQALQEDVNNLEQLYDAMESLADACGSFEFE
jgi:hypothetical protein